MTADPKPDAVTAEEVVKLVGQLSSQIGDDVQVIFNHEALFKKSRAALVYQSAEITRLRAELAEVNSEREADMIMIIWLQSEMVEVEEKTKDAHAVGFVAAIEAAARIILDEIDSARIAMPSAVPILCADLRDIRALTPPDITAAAARVLRDWADQTEWAHNNEMEIFTRHLRRALAEVKP